VSLEDPTRAAPEFPRTGLHVVAPVDADPVALLISTLALQTRSQRIALDILAPVPLSGVCTRLSRVLSDRGIDTSLQLIKPKDFLRHDLPLVACGPRCVAEAHAVDVSGATSETALRIHEAAAQVWPAGFQVASYHPLRNSVRIRSNNHPGRADEVLVRVDIGDPRDVATGAVRPEELLELFDVRVVPEDPYGLGDPGRPHSDQRLIDAATGILTAFNEDEPVYREFRRALAAALRTRYADTEIAESVFPAAMQPTVQCLGSLRLVTRNATGYIVLNGPGDRGAGFFLAGGWLEVVVAHVLAHSLPDGRAIVRNAGTAWGGGDVSLTTYAETDATFVYDNHLFVVSCKNEFNEERLFRHLDRLRALVAEFGEAHVRPVLLSTEALSDRAVMRCRAYEITAIAGHELLGVLASDTASRHPKGLLRRLTAGAVGAPSPGLGR
jgi:hypothetical protein